MSIFLPMVTRVLHVHDYYVMKIIDFFGHAFLCTSATYSHSVIVLFSSTIFVVYYYMSWYVVFDTTVSWCETPQFFD